MFLIFCVQGVADKKNVLTFAVENNGQTQQLNPNIMKTSFISYADAVSRFNNSLVLCNNITEVDTMMWDNMWGNFYQEDEETLVDIYQYYITDCTQDEVKSLIKWYDLKFLYSEVLDCFILCVDHWGTPWSGVMIEDKSAEE